MRKARLVIKDNQKVLHEQLYKLKTYQAVVDDAVIFSITNQEGKITQVNNKFTAISGYSEEELVGEGLEILEPKNKAQGLWEEIKDQLFRGKSWKGRVKFSNKNGESYWVMNTIVPIQSSSDKPPKEFFHIQKDISDVVRNEHSRLYDVIYRHEKNNEGISKNLREGIAQSMAGLRFHLIAMESQLKNGKAIHEDSILALKEILQEMMEETNDLAFDIMPQSLMKEGIQEALHSFFNRIESEFEAKIEFNGSDLAFFPIVKSAEIQLYRSITTLYLSAIKRSEKINSSFVFITSPQVGIQLSIDQSDLSKDIDSKEVFETIEKITDKINIVDGTIKVQELESNLRKFNIQITIPNEFTQEPTVTEAANY